MKPRSVHPSSYLHLWDIIEDTVVTTQGCYFKAFRCEGLESESIPGDVLVRTAESLYNDLKCEFEDHTLLQLVMLSHGNYDDFWEAYDAEIPEHRTLAHQRRKRKFYLQELNLRRQEIYLFVGDVKPLTLREFGHINEAQHQWKMENAANLGARARNALGRSGIRCTSLNERELARLYHRCLNPHLKTFEPIRRAADLLDEETLKGEPSLRARTLREELMRSEISWHDNYVKVGPQYYRVLTTEGFPDHTEFTLSECFGSLRMDFRLSVNVLFPDQKRINSGFQRARRFCNALAHGQSVEDHEKLERLDQASSLSRELATTKQKLVLYGAQIVLSSSTLHGLEARTYDFRERMKQHRLEFFEETMAHDRGFFTSLPGMATRFDRYRVMTSNNAADLLPVFVPPRGDRRPALLLLNRNRGIYSYDPVEPIRDNWNSVVLGASGSGKSVFMNMLITCVLGGSTRGRLMVVDFAGETKSSYLMVARLFGGQYIPVLSDKGLSINPFPTPRLALREDGQLQERVLSFLEVITDSLLANEGDDKDSVLFRGIIQQGIQDVYKERTDDSAPLYDDLLRKLKSYVGNDETQFERGRVQTLVDLLSTVLHGPGARLLNRPTTITVDSPFVIFDLFGVETLPSNVGQAITCLVSHYVRQVAFDDKDSTQKYIFLDEAAQHIRSKRMVALFQELYDTARKHCTSVWTILQKYEAFLQSSLAKTVQTNSTSLVLLNHANAEAAREQIINDWDLNAREAHLFRSLESKKGVYSELLLRTQIWDAHHTKRDVSAKLKLLLSPFDYQLATSDARDREKQRRYMAANPNLPLHMILEHIGYTEAA